MLAMTLDIAQRAVRLNPHWGAMAPRRTPGIGCFPKLQLVATTHSPFIVQSLRPGELVDLNPAPSGEYYKKSIEDIAEHVMRVEKPQRSARYQRMMEAAEQYYRLLRSAKGKPAPELARLKARLDELAAPFSEDPAYQAFLRMERQADPVYRPGVWILVGLDGCFPGRPRDARAPGQGVSRHVPGMLRCQWPAARTARRGLLRCDQVDRESRRA